MNRRISTWLRGRDLPWRPAAAVIAQVKAKDLGGYTDESVRAVRDALAAAEKVAADPDATQVASLNAAVDGLKAKDCLLYTSPSPRDGATSRMPSSA